MLNYKNSWSLCSVNTTLHGVHCSLKKYVNSMQYYVHTARKVKFQHFGTICEIVPQGKIIQSHFCRIQGGGGRGAPTVHLRMVKVTQTNHTFLEREFIGDYGSFQIFEYFNFARSFEQFLLNCRNFYHFRLSEKIQNSKIWTYLYATLFYGSIQGKIVG